MTDKTQQRRAGLAARRALTKAERAEKSALIAERIAASPMFKSAGIILSYRAMPDEVDLSGLILPHKTFAWPRCIAPGVMEALVPGDGGFSVGAFGIMEPQPASATLCLPESIDLVLVPCTAFDACGGRVGMGGGYYDRYLPACTHAVRLLVAFEAQRQPIVECGAADVRMDWAVTERALYDCR